MSSTLQAMLARENVEERLREAEKRRIGGGTRASRRRARGARTRTFGAHDLAAAFRLRAAAVQRAVVRSEHLVLDDGRSVRIRRLRSSDREMYRHAVAGLSSRSRYLRFASPMPAMSDPLVDQMMAFDDQHHVVYAALTRRETAVVGVVRFVRTANDPCSAEVAIAVADAWQNSGLGSVLMARVVERACRAELTSLVATTLSENHGAARLAHSSGFSMSRRSGIYTEYELELADVCC
jgi:RimJ/RimL family protein N-acetyltransferase